MTVDYDRPWVRRRELYWSTHPRRCARCGSTFDVDLHHLHYRSPVGGELDSDVIAVCRSCHRRVHELARRWRWVSLETVTRWFVREGRARRRWMA